MYNPGFPSKLAVKRMMLLQTGTYNELMRRPYHLNANSDTVSALSDATLGGQQLDHNHVAGVAGMLLRPTAQAVQHAIIDNGWSTSRFQFFMSVMVNNGITQSEEYILSGYTDFCDWSSGGDLPPELKFYVDNVITVRVAQTPLGQQAVPVNVSQVLRGNWNMGQGQSGGAWGSFQPPASGAPNDFSMRPADVVSLHSAAELVQMGSPNGAEIRHTPATFYDGTKLSTLENNMPSRYLSKTLMAECSKLVSDPYHDLGDSFPKSNPAAGLVRDITWSANPLLNILSGNTMLAHTNAGFFTWSELRALDPHVIDDQVTFVIPISQGSVKRIHQTGQTELWTAATNETVAATIMAQTIPALMGKLLLTRVAFSATNCTLDGSIGFQWAQGVGGAGFYESMDMGPALQAFQIQFIHEIFSSITYNGMYSVSISVDARLTGDLWVSIAMNGQSAVEYVAPLYAGQLYSPVLTSDYNHLQGMSIDLMSLASQVVEPAGMTNISGGLY